MFDPSPRDTQLGLLAACAVTYLAVTGPALISAASTPAVLLGMALPVALLIWAAHLLDQGEQP